ncbi:hypothetical protein IE81DRAFT_350697, partial [Ceraceosorus guamensis]
MRVGNCYDGRSTEATDALAERAPIKTDDLNGHQSTSLLSRSGASRSPTKSSMLDSRLERGCSWQEMRVGNCYRSIMDELSGAVQALAKRSTADRLSRRDDHDPTTLDSRLVMTLGERAAASLVVRDDYACYCLSHPSECSWQGPPVICPPSVRDDRADTALVHRATNAAVESGTISLVPRDNSQICYCISHPSECAWHGPPVNCRRSIAESHPLSRIAEQIELERRADEVLAADTSAEPKRRLVHHGYCYHHPTAPNCGGPGRRGLVGATRVIDDLRARLVRRLQPAYCSWDPTNAGCHTADPPKVSVRSVVIEARQRIPVYCETHPTAEGCGHAGLQASAMGTQQLNPIYCAQHPKAPGCGHPGKRDLAARSAATILQRQEEYCLYFPHDPDCQPKEPPGHGGGGEHPPRRDLASVGDETAELSRRLDPPTFCSTHPDAPKCKPPHKPPHKRSSGDGAKASFDTKEEVDRRDGPGPFCPIHSNTPECQGTKLPPRKRSNSGGGGGGIGGDAGVSSLPQTRREEPCEYGNDCPDSGPSRRSNSAMPSVDVSAREVQHEHSKRDDAATLERRLQKAPCPPNDPLCGYASPPPPKRGVSDENDAATLERRLQKAPCPPSDPFCKGSPPRKRSDGKRDDAATLERRLQQLPCPPNEPLCNGSPPGKRSDSKRDDAATLERRLAANPACLKDPTSNACTGKNQPPRRRSSREV